MSILNLPRGSVTREPAAFAGHHRPAVGEMRGEVETRFLEFMRARTVDEHARGVAKAGRFSAFPHQPKADLFGSLDILYAAHILGLLGEITDVEGRAAWIEHILGFQDPDGWFLSRDRQAHGVEHATAYALGGLQILTGGDGSLIANALRPFHHLVAEMGGSGGSSGRPSLSLLDRVHFWRGSHRAAGIAAIVAAVRDLGLSSDKFLGIASPSSWLQRWWGYFAERVDPATGYWALAPRPLHIAFNAMYQFRHRPDLASMGGAAHLYWISEKLSAPMPYPAAAIPTTIALMQSTGLYEGEPYCIDLDANFIIARALAYLPPADRAHGDARRALATNREAVLRWFASRNHQEWNPNSHRLPGAFAAVGEVDRTLPSRGGRQWRDIFETTWWL